MSVINLESHRDQYMGKRPISVGSSALESQPGSCDSSNRYGFKLGRIALAGRAISERTNLPLVGEATPEEIQRQPNSFLQITTRVNQKDGPGSDQASFVSFGLAGGINTIFPVIRAVRSGLPQAEGVTIKTRGFGEEVIDQISIYIEAKVGDLDPKQLLRTTVLSPNAVYDGVKGLKSQSELQRARWEAMFAPGGKGRLHLAILNGEIQGQIQAYNPDGTDHFVAKLKVIENKEVAGVAMDGEMQTYTSLAIHPKVSASMRQKILAEQEWIAQTPEDMIRTVITINADPTIECCRFSVSAMLDKVLNAVTSGVEYISGVGDSLIKSAGSYVESLREKITGFLGRSAAQEKDYCSKCYSNKTEQGECKCNEKS